MTPATECPSVRSFRGRKPCRHIAERTSRNTEMQTAEILKRCKCLVSQPDCRATYLRDVQSRTRGISGYLSNYVPEEIVAAAGFHPLRIIGRYETSRPHGQSLYSPVCAFARDMFAAAGSGAFSFLRHVIFPNSCDSLRVLQQMWETSPAQPPVHVLLHPIRADDHSVRYFARQIEVLADTLRSQSGVRYTDSGLADQIRRYNQTRQMLRQLYAESDGEAPFLKGSDRIALVTAAMIMDRDEYNRMLRQIAAESQCDASVGREGGKRIMVVGPLVDHLELLETIEGCGASIVADDVTNGSRYFELDVVLDGDLYENLARRYLHSGSSPTMNSSIYDHEGLFRERIRRLGPDGVVFIHQKFCDPHVHNYLAKREVLREMKVHALMLEVEHDRAAVSERDLLRIESFLEMLDEG